MRATAAIIFSVRSRSLYAVVNPSVVCLSSLVCNVRAPYSAGNFWKCFYAI